MNLLYILFGLLLIASIFAASVFLIVKNGKKIIKRGIWQSFHSDLHGMIQYEMFAAETVRESEDMEEGVKALQEKRKPKFKGR